MNLSQIEHFKRLNPTGIKWEDMTDQQKEELREQWNAIVSVPKNVNCTCPRTGCRNNRNCQFCLATHRFYGSLPDCLRVVDDKLSEGVPPEKRHNIHSHMNPTQKQATNRTEYAEGIAERMRENPSEEAMAAARARTEEWHKLVRVPENIACHCPRTDCWYHGNCAKCLALHRSLDGFPYCCQEIYDKIDAAVQAHKQSAEA